MSDETQRILDSDVIGEAAVCSRCCFLAGAMVAALSVTQANGPAHGKQLCARSVYTLQILLPFRMLRADLLYCIQFPIRLPRLDLTTLEAMSHDTWPPSRALRGPMHAVCYLQDYDWQRRREDLLHCPVHFMLFLQLALFQQKEATVSRLMSHHS